MNERLKIELLYFEGCPHFKETFRILKEVLKEESLPSSVVQICIDTDEEAERFKFLGSPTVRVNGVDVDPAVRETTDFGFRCRLYWLNGKATPHPPKEMIREAIKKFI